MAARDEERAVQVLRERFQTATAFVQRHDGRVFNTAGDALLAEFASPVEAVRCALEIQEAMQTANDKIAETDRLVFRIGINLGDVIVNGTDLLGDGVNVAARLESLASPGGICVSSNVYEQLVGKLTLGAEDLGPQHVKNIPRPIHAYRLTPEGAPPAAAAGAAWAGRLKRRVVVPVLGVVVALGALATVLAIGATHWPGPATPQAASASAASHPLVPEDIPYLDDRAKDAIRTQYLPARPAKALAIAGGRNLFAWVADQADTETAQKQALEKCATELRRVTEDQAAHAPCRLYAVGDEVFSAFRLPPMPPQPWVATDRPVPATKVDPEKVPLATAAARRAIAEHYLPGGDAKAIALGRRGVAYLVWQRSSDFAALRGALESCAAITERPCFIYALGNDVVVHVPQAARIVDAFAPEDLDGVSDADRHRIDTTYLPDGSWRALAIGGNGRIGLGLRQASEQQAIDQAMSDCAQAGGLECTLIAVGPFKVAAR
jgi:adenylate cyclase